MSKSARDYLVFAAVCLACVLCFGCGSVAPAKPDQRDPVVIRTHPNVNYPAPR
jgi:predicted component of type VI protein secretion system